MTTNEQPGRGPARVGPLGIRMDLIALREAKCWTTRDLAAVAQIVHGTVQRTERGFIPRPRVQFALAAALEVAPTVVVPVGARQWTRA